MMPSVAISPSDAPRLQRAKGDLRLEVALLGGRTRLSRLYQEGAAKARLPRQGRTDGASALEAVLINTAGGLTGGDAMRTEIAVGPGASLTVTTQACEKLYRASAGVAEVVTRATLGAGGRLNWLPQETILFDRAALTRRFEADLDEEATLLAVEGFIFGRQAMGETVRSASLRERWRVRRAGRLVFADDLKLDGAVSDILARPAVAAGARALATVLLVGRQAEAFGEAARAALVGLPGVNGGASAFDGRLVTRIVADDGLCLRRGLVALLDALRPGTALPKVWAI